MHSGGGTKRGREGRRSGSRAYKRHRPLQGDDSDDSLLVDEVDQGPGAPFLRASRASSHPWLLPPGFESSGAANWGMGASAWGQPGSHWGSATPGIFVVSFAGCRISHMSFLPSMVVVIGSSSN